MPDTSNQPHPPSTPAPETGRGREVLVALAGVDVAFCGRAVLEGVDLTVRRGEIVSVVGVNGGGKTTLVRVAAGLLAPDRGHVERRPGITIGYTPQVLPRDPSLPITAGRFLALRARVSRVRRMAALEEVGCAHLFDTQLAEVSGGELHRIALARALLRTPDLLVLDEPMTGVDVAGQSELYRLLVDVRNRYGCGVLLVSHDLHLVMAATDTVVCLNHHVCCTGRPQAVVTNPEFVALFGTRVADALAVYEHHHDHGHDAAGAVLPLDDRPGART